MVFKIFCDINVSHIKEEDLYGNENISYEFIPKFDDDKENWDPHCTKKHPSISVQSYESIISKKDNDVPIKNAQEERKKLILGEKESVIENIISKKSKLKEKSSKPISEKKIGPNEKENLKKRKDLESEIEIENVKENLKMQDRKISSYSSENDTIEFEENVISENSITLIQKRKRIEKRQRRPLEDITSLFVPEESLVSPKRTKIVKDDEEKSSEKIDSSLKNSKSISLKEKKESIEKFITCSETSKENKSPKCKTPLGNINHHSSININNNTNIKCINNSQSITISKPCLIDVKKNKPGKRTYRIPKKALKSSPKLINFSPKIFR